jgi:glycosyltransferase involved in cell wall biosynthesis
VKPVLSVVVPVYNEIFNVDPVVNAVAAVFDERLSGYELELLFVDDGSTDGTGHAIELAHTRDPRVRLLELSRNFGKEAALTAGLMGCRGQAAITLDGDLQHPPERLPDFVDAWERGADVVVGIRSEAEGVTVFKRLGSFLFSAVMRRMSETEFLSGSTDFRLMDRQVIDAFGRLAERKRITRGLIDWLGFRRVVIEFRAASRQHGKARYDFRKLVGLALSAIVSHSLVPLKLAGYLGAFITLVGSLLGAFIVLNKYILHDPWGLNFSGPAMLAVFILVLNGLVLMCLGVMAWYIGAILGEVTGRPLFVVREARRETLPASPESGRDEVLPRSPPPS